MKDKILMIVFVLALGSILTAALVAVNYLTTPVIEKNEEIATKSSILKALSISFEPDQVEETFANKVKQRQRNGTTYYVAEDGNIAFPYSGSGLWGPIEGIVAIQPNFETLEGVTISRQEETPGLGSRITEPQYLAQFEGKRFAEGLKLVQPGIDAPARQQLAVRAVLGDAAFIEHDNPICILDRGQTVRNDHGRHSR